MALQERFPEKRGRGMKRLLQAAKKAGFLRDEGFPSLKHRRENAAMLDEQMAPIVGQTPETLPEKPYVDVLIEGLPNVRNNPGIVFQESRLSMMMRVSNVQ
jgi:hypothetical protein